MVAVLSAHKKLIFSHRIGICPTTAWPLVKHDCRGYPVPVGYGQDMDLTLWSDWGTFWGAVVGAAVTYLFAVVALRIAGRRTLAQMSAFDVVVTVAVGTLVASTALPSNASLADGAAVLVTFLLLQVLIGALRQRVGWFQRWVDFRPKVVMHDGRPELRTGLSTAQLTLSDLESRLRQSGIGSLDEVRIAVLEPTGKLTVSREEPAPELFRQTKESPSR
jgi:uncharacterized membrane protein YcaP (DUF421 family)